MQPYVAKRWGKVSKHYPRKGTETVLISHEYSYAPYDVSKHYPRKGTET